MILLDALLHELGEVEIDIDVEVGSSESTNDFEMNTATIQEANAKGFYIPNTEIGGLFEYSKGSSNENHEKVKGWTWRGLLTQSIIEPPSGSDYRVVSGDANTIIGNILSGVLGDFFYVPSAASGLTITSYQFPLYVNVLDGLEGMLEAYGYRLLIVGEKVASGQPIRVRVEAVQAQTVSGTYNEDNGITMTYEKNDMGINHLVCVGSGQLQERMKVNLYINALGKVTQTQYYTGFNERTAVYDYGSAESEQDLIDGGTERLLELASSKSFGMKAPEIELEIGDLVKGQYPDGTIITVPVIQKIFKIEGGITTTEVKVKGEN